MSKISILVVEDEAIVAADLACKLAQLGYEVVGSAARGEEAIELACRMNPDIVLMDIRLKGSMDGIEAAEAIRRNIDIPLIYLTAHSDTATLDRAKVSEPFGYILKPFEERELSTNIEMALHKHRAERQMREQREWMRVTLNSIGDAVITCDIDGRVTFLNPVAEALTGWPNSEAQARPIGDVFRLKNEQGNQQPADPLTLVLREAQHGNDAEYSQLVTRDGREIPIEDNAAPIQDANGKVIGEVLVFRDVSGKRRAEEAIRERGIRLMRAEEMAHLGHWRYELATGRLSMSDEMYRILGLRRQEEQPDLTLEEVMQLCHPDDLQHCVRSFEPSGELELRSCEYRIFRPDGEERHVVSNGEPERDEQGRLIALFGTILDTSELKRRERELQEKNAELERFTYMISHDLKSPLVTFNTFLGYLEKDLANNDSGRIAKDLHFMSTAAGRMWRLLDELLEMSQVGRKVNQPVTVTCKEVIEEALALVAGHLAARGVRVLTEIPEIMLHGDRPRLVEIWQNLIENSCKFMGSQAEPIIEIGVEGRGRMTSFYVRDNGMGIEPKYQEKIFGLFEQLDRNAEGSGLGLALVRRLVELNGGNIRVESQGRGKGACFSFTLPGAVKDIA